MTITEVFDDGVRNWREIGVCPTELKAKQYAAKLFTEYTAVRVQEHKPDSWHIYAWKKGE